MPFLGRRCDSKQRTFFRERKIGANDDESNSDLAQSGQAPAAPKSKKQKELERKKRMKERLKKEAQEATEKNIESHATADSKNEGQEEKTQTGIPLRKSKKKAADLDKILNRINERQSEMERIKREEEEELRKEREEEEKMEKERLAKEMERARKKQLKAQKIEQMKKDGTYLTPAQKQAKAAREKRLEMLMSSGMKIPAMSQDADQTDKPANKGSKIIKKRSRKVQSSKLEAHRQQEQNSRVSDLKTSSKSFETNEDIPKIQEIQPQSEANIKGANDTVEQDNDLNREPGASNTDEEQIYDSTDSSDSGDEDSVPQDWLNYLNQSPDEKKEAPKKVTTSIPASKKKSVPVIKKSKAKDKDAVDIDKEVEVEKSKEMRAVICCILGHVDTGKTKLLDKIRQSNVQGAEAGGITQQIGATFFPINTIIEKTNCLYKGIQQDYLAPGLLVIDTPGHESFSNLRERGNSLCNIAILVVDIMHGLEKQTIESLKILRNTKTPFIVALNKIDRIYNWKMNAEISIRENIEKQEKSARDEFEMRLSHAMVQFSEEGINTSLLWKNEDMSNYANIIPVSALTGEGIPDLLDFIMKISQSKIASKITYSDKVQCTVLEVKVAEGLGTVIDVILSNGTLEEGQRIAICGTSGPIITTIRFLLTPQPLSELRENAPFVYHKKVKAALGVRIAASNLEKAVAGSRLMVLGPNDDKRVAYELMDDLNVLMKNISKDKRGVCVQASSLGSLEALVSFLKYSKVPILGIGIGPVHKKDVVRAAAALETNPEYALILAFDVHVDRDIQLLAQNMNVKIFTADIIYHLFDQFTKHMDDEKKKKIEENKDDFSYPCILKIIPSCIFNKVDPIILGVDCVAGKLQLGVQLCAINGQQPPLILGRVVGIEHNKVSKKEILGGGPSVSIKIEAPKGFQQKGYGRGFNEKSFICSYITSNTLDLFKTLHKDSLRKEDIPLLEELKRKFKL